MKKFKNMKNMKNISLSVFTVLVLSACSTTSKSTVEQSFLKQNKNASEINIKSTQQTQALTTETVKAASQSGMSYLSPLAANNKASKQAIELTAQFSDKKRVKLTADDLPLKDYLHYVLGDLLGVSYILGDKLKADNKAVTLNLQKDITERRLFTLSEELLSERGYVIRLEDDIFYIHKAEAGNAAGFVYGYGSNISDVPATSQNIIQMVPFEYGLKNDLSIILPGIAKVIATSDRAHQAFILRGKRREIIKALEFIQLMDQPGFKNRHIGAYKSTFVSNEVLLKKLPELLLQEGITVSANNQTDKTVSFVSLERLGTTIIFANSQLLIDRVGFWAKNIDQPASGDELQYFIYSPKYSSAKDLGESLQSLFGGGQSADVSNTTSAATENKKNNSKNKSKTSSIKSENMTISVDERANALIFETTGQQYRKIHDLIKRLDILPKQVALEVVIAEVTLTDEFRQGVEFAFSKGKFSAGNKGSMGVSEFGGLSLGWVGPSGEVSMQLFQSNSLVNILSRPSLVVRDGIEANINVGTEIPVVSETKTSDQTDVSTSSITYRKTGVSLEVTPTINGQGVIVMQVRQSISNTVDTDTQTTTPSIFSRDITTEVIAENGQTVLLGGLISETTSNGDTAVPFFSSIPIIGALFQAKKDKTDKTELVVMITPRIIESTKEWDEIKANLATSLSSITVE